MPLLFEVMKWTHVAAGVVSLLAAPLAMAARKGGHVHRLAGQVYFWGMAAIFVTAVGMSLFRPNMFLIGVSVLSFYGTLAGRRALSHKADGRRPDAADWGAAVAVLLTGAVLAGWGGLQIAVGTQTGTFAVLGVVFGLLIVQSAASDMRRFLRAPAPREWWFVHMNHMLGSFVGLMTAFLVQTVAPRLLDAGLPSGWVWVVWVAPAVIGTPAIAYWMGVYRRRFGLERGGRAGLAEAS